MEGCVVVISTKNILKWPLDVYDLDKEIELWDLDHCLPEWYWLSYEWTRYKRRREKLVRELQLNLSDDRIELQQQ